MSFCSLQHIRNRRSTYHGLSRPATFRLQGLVTLVTAYSLQSRAGFVSHRQRSWDSPFGAFSSQEEPGLLPPSDPTYRFTCRCSRRRSEGPAQQAFGSWDSTSRESLASRQGVSSPIAGCSLGLRPSRVSRRSPCPGFRPSSSHALPRASNYSPARRRPRVSISSRLT
jgi:hypothetical protein